MTNRNHIRKFFAEETMTDKQCNKYIQLAFEEKKAKTQSCSLSDSDDDKENSMPKHSLEKKNSFKQSPTVQQEDQVNHQAKEFKRRQR
jgi:hypothetical protein